MSDMPSTSSPDALTSIAIEVLPVTEEEDDLDTLASVQRVRVDLQHDLTKLDGYVVSTVPTSERSIDALFYLH